MKKLVLAIALALVTGFAGMGMAATAKPAATKPMTSKPAVTKHIATEESLQRYWAREKERQTLARDHYKEVLSVYEKYNGATKEAREEVKGLDQKYDADLKALNAKYKDVSKEDKAAGRNIAKLRMEREEFLKSHPDIQTDIASLKNEIKELKVKIAEKERAMKAEVKPMAPKTGGTNTATQPK
jgi:chromosome segregation ATPase